MNGFLGNGQLCLCSNWGSEAAYMAYFTVYMICPKHNMLNKHRTYVRAGIEVIRLLVPIKLRDQRSCPPLQDVSFQRVK